MAHLRVADSHEIETIYRESHQIWGGGLTRQDYLQVWRELEATPWGRRYMAFLVWVDDRGRILSSMKLYRPMIRCNDETARGAVIGAVFTPRKRRRRGHAAAMLREALRVARVRGDRPALLFSDVGVRYYAALGFRALPAEECWGRLKASPRADAALTIEPMGERDHDAVFQAHGSTTRDAAIAIVRDREHWDFVFARSRGFFDRIAHESVTQRNLVAVRNGEFVGYLITVESPGEWSVREVGASDGRPATMIAILRAGAADALSRGMRTLHGWMPRAVSDALSEWRIRREKRQRAIPMIAPLTGRFEPDRISDPDRLFLPFMDQF